MCCKSRNMNKSISFKSKMSRKMKKYSCMLREETGIAEASKSEYLMVCNAGLVSGIKQETIVDVFSKYGIWRVVMIPGKSYSFVELTNDEVASQAVVDINGKLVLPEVRGPLYLLPVEKMPLNSAINCEHKPRGLLVIYDFITEDEEQYLINFMNNELDDPDTSGNQLKHRAVKHYGYAFDYKTNNIDKMNSTCKSIPKQFEFIIERFGSCSNKLKNWRPDQVTVNVYQPGQGIPPHVDTHSAFDGFILSLSVGSDVTMDFKNVESSQFFCQLRKRSLLIMADESRYGWSHGIVSRKFDVVENATGLTNLERSRRISFTFRRTLKNYICHCSFTMFCDSQNSTNANPSFKINNGVALELERIHVHEVYDKIADHFSETRLKPWPSVDAFVKSFAIGSIYVDIGCGNGKNLGLNANVFQIGCDRTEKFVSECFQKGYEALVCDCLQLPFRSNAIDYCLCIAVIHHLSTEERRLAALKEIVRILRPQGKALVYVWAKNQKHNENSSSYLRRKTKNKRQQTEIDVEHSVQWFESTSENISLPVHVNRTQFKYEDVFVPWMKKTEKVISNDASVYLRYYHVFDEGELEKLCNSIENVKILLCYYDQGNWCVIIQKIS